MRTLRNSPIVWAVVLAVCALVLGYAGYRSLPGNTLSRSDALFSSIQLFGLEGGVPPQGTPWTLNLARFMAPLAVVYTTVVALMTIMRDQIQRVLVAVVARDHIVHVGLGKSNALLATSLRQSGHRVVVVEADATHERIAGTRAHGARVLIGDATQPVILQRAQVPRAQHVIVATGDDSRNLEVAEQARRIAVAEGGGRRTTLHVAIVDHALWAELGRLQVARAQAGLVVEFYNLIDRAAQALLNEAERLCGENVYRCVVVEGDGPLAQRTLVHLVRRSALAGSRPKVHISESTAAKAVAPLLEQEPWIGQSADFVGDAMAADAGSTAPVALVCMSASDAEAMASALALAKPAGTQTVLVSVQGQQTEALLESAGVETRIHLVPTSIKAVGNEFLHQSGLELMARVRHEDYLARECALGATASDNSSLVPWDELPESLKESNRRFAESVGDVVHALGGYLVPLQHLEPERPFLRTGATLERLAKAEHDRWMDALRRDGWTHAPGPKDPHRKTHPLLVGWSELEEGEKEKDRDAIRAVPRMLARVGFAIEFPERGVGHADARGS